MATFQSEAVKSGIMPDHSLAGVVQCRTVEYTAAAEMAIDSVIQMVPMKTGMKVLDIHVSWTALGTGVLVDIGDATIDRYFDGVDAAAAGSKTLIADGVPAEGLNYKFTIDDTIDFKNLVAVIPAAAVIKMNVYYKMQGVIEDEG